MELAELLVAERIGIVYGGAKAGLMGVLSDTAIAAGGEVIGVIPQPLVDREIAHRGLTDLRVVGSMHERKALMADLADAFIAAPGGTGTLEELVEVFTWLQLGLHAKPVGLLDVLGYWEHFVAFLDHATRERFMRVEHRSALFLRESPGELLAALREADPPAQVKWINRAQS